MTTDTETEAVPNATALARRLTAEWLFAARITPQAKVVGLALLQSVAAGAEPSMHRLAFMTSLDEQSVKRHLLLLAGLLQPGIGGRERVSPRKGLHNSSR